MGDEEPGTLQGRLFFTTALRTGVQREAVGLVDGHS